MVMIQDDYGDTEFLSPLEHEILVALVDQADGKGSHTVVSEVVAALPRGLDLSTSETLRRTETLLWLAFYELDDVVGLIAPEATEERAEANGLHNELYSLMDAFVRLQERIQALPEQPLETTLG